MSIHKGVKHVNKECNPDIKFMEFRIKDSIIIERNVCFSSYFIDLGNLEHPVFVYATK